MSRSGKNKSGLFMLTTAGAVTFLATALTAMPASIYSVFLDFDKHQVAYAHIEGTVWRGRVTRLSVAGVPMGDVGFQLSPLSLLILSPSAKVSAQNGAVLGRGDVNMGFGSRLTVSDLRMRVSLEDVAPTGVLGQPAKGYADITVDRLSYTLGEGCRTAVGTIWTDVLNAPAQRYQLSDLPLSGAIECNGGVIMVQMQGENAQASTELNLRVFPNLTYEVTAFANPSGADVASALRFFGFEDGNEGALVYGAAGVFRGAGS